MSGALGRQHSLEERRGRALTDGKASPRQGERHASGFQQVGLSTPRTPIVASQPRHTPTDTGSSPTLQVLLPSPGSELWPPDFFFVLIPDTSVTFSH